MAKNCQSITQMLLTAGSSLCLPQYAERLVGLLYCRSGGCVLRADPPLSIQTGSAAVYPAWHPHRLDTQEDTSLFFCTVSCVQDETILPQLIELQQTQLNEWAQIMEQMLESVYARDLSRQLLESTGMEPADIPLYVQSARRIIDNDYGADLTLDELSARVGRSKYHLSRAFRDHYKITPGAYLTAVRLTRAKELLTNTGLPVREIGQQVGFPNSAYFTTLFKQRFGCPPNEFRVLQKSGGQVQT